MTALRVASKQFLVSANSTVCIILLASGSSKLDLVNGYYTVSETLKPLLVSSVPIG